MGATNPNHRYMGTANDGSLLILKIGEPSNMVVTHHKIIYLLTVAAAQQMHSPLLNLITNL